VTVKTDLAIVVDRIRCDGYGMCAELLPELVELDDWGYPILRTGAVPFGLVEHARRAVAVCPVLALGLREVAAPQPRARNEHTTSRAAARREFRRAAARHGRRP
jgi:ferredoxin